MNPRPDKRAADMQQEMSNFVNASPNVRDFVSLMAKDHRTLQANFTKLCIAWLERAAQQYLDEDFDLRNADECEKAFHMVNAIRQ